MVPEGCCLTLGETSRTKNLLVIALLTSRLLHVICMGVTDPSGQPLSSSETWESGNWKWSLFTFKVVPFYFYFEGEYSLFLLCVTLFTVSLLNSSICSTHGIRKQAENKQTNKKFLIYLSPVFQQSCSLYVYIGLPCMGHKAFDFNHKVCLFASLCLLAGLNS